MSVSISENPLFAKLSSLDNILIAGAGGGYDIYSGVPLYMALRRQGKTVHLSNFSFSFLHKAIAKEIFSKCFAVDASKITHLDYFPEKYLAVWLKNVYQEDIPVYSIPQTGVMQLKSIYQYLKTTLNLEAIVLIDGGTDSLMFGDEAGLGTPSEDSASIAAVNALENLNKYLVCLGFGIDHFHGVPHYSFLENVATLTQENAYLGCFSITNQNTEGFQFLELVKYANQCSQHSPSIVANSVASAIEGKFGNFHATTRTRNSELFINPLMNLYWAFELEAVARHIQFLPHIAHTREFADIRYIIQAYRAEITPKKRKQLPL